MEPRTSATLAKYGRKVHRIGWDRSPCIGSVAVGSTGVFSRRIFEQRRPFEIMKVALFISATGPPESEGIHLTPRVHYPPAILVWFLRHHYIDSPISTIYLDNEALI
jgi:hypothetical protein